MRGFLRNFTITATQTNFCRNLLIFTMFFQNRNKFLLNPKANIMFPCFLQVYKFFLSGILGRGFNYEDLWMITHDNPYSEYSILSIFLSVFNVIFLWLGEQSIIDDDCTAVATIQPKFNPSKYLFHAAHQLGYDFWFCSLAFTPVHQLTT